ncbi:phytanoyl-CoA dioxygenase family protein [Chondrinema litorale]|uniref:phytanoyl-CoA dioxygenase family protein n=1 Tax=Chondrinema litorale TaxID=2994555 RepID=UPI0025434BCA|nr:phytanoyl-CoA dioxygenase family protein [Chondrinema litorale]UZR94456.1 phytanoyl-CoA dioxygenase family protein [Chondrinema litorale]
MKNYLQNLGVTESILTISEKQFLDDNGYLNLGKILSDELLNSVREVIDSLLVKEGLLAGAELMDSKYIRHPKEVGADRLADLVNKHSIFDLFYTHPRVLAAVAHVLNSSVKLSSLNYRAAIPGSGLQNLHVDWHETVDLSDFKVCNSIWLLDDFSKENGATRIVPGTHLLSELPQDVLKDTKDSHENEIIINAPAGSVFIFNSHVWHGGTTNNSSAARRAIHSYFCRRDQPQQIDQKRYITSETRERISEEARFILDID